MFGRYTFSKAPFAGQGSNAFFLSQTEDFTPTDTATVGGAFISSITEVLTSEDTNAEHAVYYFGNVDDMYTAQDVSDIDVNYPVSFSDGVSCEEVIAITAQFAGSVDEAMESLEELSGGIVVYFGIVEDVAVADPFTENSAFIVSRAESFSSADSPVLNAQFNVSRSEEITMAEYLTTHGWIRIDTSQVTLWTPIVDQQ